jgi:hypothetical protein
VIEKLHSQSDHPQELAIVGSSGAHVLYGALTALTRLGVRFTAEGPLLPATATVNARAALTTALFDPAEAFPARYAIISALTAVKKEIATPAFEFRGFQPWGSYPMGNDWWDADEYRRVVENIVGLKGNWIGMHDYANDYPFPEPGVAVLSDASGLLPDGNLSVGGVAYTGTWAANERAAWGLDGMPTAGYAYGAATLFDWDCYANRGVAGGDAALCPSPVDSAGVALTFNRVGALYASVFAFAAQLNVSTALGTEIPLTVPASNDTEAIVPLMVWWSAARNDTFVTTTQCAECLGLYVLLGIAGYVYVAPGPGRVPLSTYWAPNYLDALLTVDPPTDAAYTFTRIEGYGLVFNASGNEPPVEGTLVLQPESRQYFKEMLAKTCVDTWAVSGANFTANASARGYVNSGSSVALILSTPPATSQLFQAYNATLTRMALLYGENLTWYWAWTAEGWQWNKVSQDDPAVAAALNDVAVIEQVRAANAARGAPLPFGFGLNGWILGPYDNRSFFDAHLPQDWALGSLDGYLGKSPPDPGFSEVTHREQKWSQVGGGVAWIG